jgi:F-type H+-transporting ATPase subunit delta
VSRIAFRYSKALFELSLEKETFAEVENDLQSIKSIIENNNDFRSFLLNPLIPAKIKTVKLKNIFKDSVNQLTLNFLIFLSSKKRSEFLLEVIERFEEFATEHKGILKAQLYSVYPLDSNQKETIKNRLEKDTEKIVHLTENIEKSLLGGFVIKIRDSVVDYSLRRQIEKLREKLIYS